jgi:hypothetical protein
VTSLEWSCFCDQKWLENFLIIWEWLEKL